MSKMLRWILKWIITWVTTTITVKLKTKAQGMELAMRVGSTDTQEPARSLINHRCTPSFKWWIVSKPKEANLWWPRDHPKSVDPRIISIWLKTIEEQEIQALSVMELTQPTIRMRKINPKLHHWISSSPHFQYSMCSLTGRTSHLQLSNPMEQV